MSIEIIPSPNVDEAKAKLEALLAPCFTDKPSAGAVILVNSAHGTAFFSINMDTEELLSTLLLGGEFLAEHLGVTNTEGRTLQ